MGPLSRGVPRDCTVCSAVPAVFAYSKRIGNANVYVLRFRGWFLQSADDMECQRMMMEDAGLTRRGDSHHHH
jgi:hypothetical protein